MNDSGVRRALSKLLTSALDISAKRGSKRVAIELFSGTGRIGHTLNRLGFGCVCIDIKFGHSHDLTRSVVQSTLTGWITSGVILCVWIGLPCNSWSRARHDLDGGGPRSAQYIWGKPLLSPADSLRVSLGNNTLKFSCKLVRLCKKLGVIACVENPHTSMAWQAPPLTALLRTAHSSVTDYCQYNMPWRKRTRVASWNLDVECVPGKRCLGRSGICSRTKQPHIQLTGAHPALHIPWTKVAEPYPWPWSRQWCKAIENTFINKSLLLDNQLLCAKA